MVLPFLFASILFMGGIVWTMVYYDLWRIIEGLFVYLWLFTYTLRVLHGFTYSDSTDVATSIQGIVLPWNFSGYVG
jgi:hypothetical protein